MTVSLQGFNKQVATFARAEVEDEVTDCANGDLFIGLCVGVDGDHCAVQLSGYARVALAATGAPTAVGYAFLASDENGCVKELNTGRELLILELDSDSAAILL